MPQALRESTDVAVIAASKCAFAALTSGGTLAAVKKIMLRVQQDFACGLAAFECPMRVGGVGKREASSDANVEFALAYPAKDFASPLEQILAGQGVVDECRSCQEHRALLAQDLRVHRWHRAARLSKEDHRSPGL